MPTKQRTWNYTLTIGEIDGHKRYIYRFSAGFVSWLDGRSVDLAAVVLALTRTSSHTEAWSKWRFLFYFFLFSSYLIDSLGFVFDT